jgi:hypothetical protein
LGIYEGYVSDVECFNRLQSTGYFENRVFRVNNDGIRRRSPVKDALIHVFTEELRHRDEKIAIPWQMDIEPPDMGWLSVMKKTIPLWIMK